jgi:hypothetical protein
MPELFGCRYSPEELLRRVGRINQVGGELTEILYHRE